MESGWCEIGSMAIRSSDHIYTSPIMQSHGPVNEFLIETVVWSVPVDETARCCYRCHWPLHKAHVFFHSMMDS